MTDPRSLLVELIATWRDAAVWEHDDMHNTQSAQTFDQCADELEALLARVERPHQEPEFFKPNASFKQVKDWQKRFTAPPVPDPRDRAVAGGMVGTDPAPECAGVIAARERLEPEGSLNPLRGGLGEDSQLSVARAQNGVTDRRDGHFEKGAEAEGRRPSRPLSLLEELEAINAAAEADMLKGNPVTGAHHRAIERRLKELKADPGGGRPIRSRSQLDEEKNT